MNNRQKLVQKQFLNNEEAVIKRLNQVYRKSLSDVEDKIKNLQFDIGRLQAEYNWMDPDDPEKEKVKSQIQSKIYQKQYQEQLQRQLDGILKQMQKDQYLTVSDYLDGCYTDGFVGTIFDLSGQGVPLMMPIDQQSMVHAVQLDSKISHGLYTRLGEDVDLLKKKITAQVSRSIATGESFEQVARQLAGYTSIGYNNAIRIARTEGHRIQTTATMDALYGAKERGADVVKQWDSTLDARTRESHVKVDGEWKELEEKFSNGLRYPGDPHGAAAEVINCRCALLQRARWALADGFTKRNGFTDQLETFETPEKYAEFKEAFFSKENRQYMNFVGQMEEKYGKNFNKVLESMTEQEYQHYSELLNATPIYKNIEFSQTVKITKKSYDLDYGIVDRNLVNSKEFHDKFASLGVNKNVQESLYQESMKMLEHRDGTGFEDLVIIDSKTGKVVERITDVNEFGKVGITKEQYKNITEYEGKLILLHNHPNGSRPSIEDIAKLKEKNIDSIISVGHNGSVYRIFNLKPQKDVDKKWKSVYNDLRKTLEDDTLANNYAHDYIYKHSKEYFDIEIG